MVWAVLLFHGNLGDFLAREHRGQSFRHACARAATLKNAIEALGVPHTEVVRVEVDGQAVPLSRPVREGDRVEVHPQEREALAEGPRFLADAHLGGLARFLRMLGYNTLHENQIVSRLIGLGAALTILFAYRPPPWIKRRFGVAAIAEG